MVPAAARVVLGARPPRHACARANPSIHRTGGWISTDARGSARPYVNPMPSSSAPSTRAGRRSGDVVVDPFARAYADTLRVGDPLAAADVVDRALADGVSAAAIQSHVIAPAMREIGVMWERGVASIAHEHLATAVSHHVLTRLYPSLLRTPRRADSMIVVAAVHGEHHVLGLRMACDVLEGAGFDVRFLGPDVPMSALLALVEEHHPLAVALGVTMPLGAAMLARQLRALREADPGVRLIVGGQGVPAILRRGAGVLYAADTLELTEHAARLADEAVAGELPPAITGGGGAQFTRALFAPDVTDGMEARLTKTTAAAADAARGQARRAFVLEQIAFRDPLTELWNRRAFDDRYQELTASEQSAPPALLMIDVDRFKAVNDGFGHDAGDRALVGVAGCIRRALRPDDFAARYGGDEFVVLLPETAPGIAAEIGERIRAEVERELTAPPLTVSIGVTAPRHRDQRRASLDVDHALYQAKESGRNQVAFA